MKGENGSGAGIGIEAVGEAGFDAGGLVAEGERPEPGGEYVGEAMRVLVGLDLDTGEGMAGRLRLHHPGGLAVDVEEIVGLAMARLQGEIANGDAAAGVDVGAAVVLNQPARRP